METNTADRPTTTITYHCSACGVEYPDGNNLCHPTAIVDSIMTADPLLGYSLADVAAMADLRAEALAAGDMAQAILCDLALGDTPDPAMLEALHPSAAARYGAMGQADAAEVCAAAIASAQAARS